MSTSNKNFSRKFGFVPDDELSAAIEFVYDIQDAEIPEDIPDGDRKTLESYKDDDMTCDIDACVHSMMASHRAIAARQGMKGTGMDQRSYIELLGKLGVFLFRNGYGKGEK